MDVARVDLVVLGLLAEEPLYGYELIERFRSRALGRWTEVGRASVYQALQRLEGDRSVAGRDEGGARGPDRRVYRITRPGRDRLRRGLLERFGAEAGYRSDPAEVSGYRVEPSYFDGPRFSPPDFPAAGSAGSPLQQCLEGPTARLRNVQATDFSSRASNSFLTETH